MTWNRHYQQDYPYRAPKVIGQKWSTPAPHGQTTQVIECEHLTDVPAALVTLMPTVCERIDCYQVIEIARARYHIVVTYS